MQDIFLFSDNCKSSDSCWVQQLTNIWPIHLPTYRDVFRILMFFGIVEDPALLLQTALESKKILFWKQHQQFISTTEELPLTNIEVALVTCVLVSYLVHFQNKQHLLSCGQKEHNSTAQVCWSFAPSLSFGISICLSWAIFPSSAISLVLKSS